MILIIRSDARQGSCRLSGALISLAVSAVNLLVKARSCIPGLAVARQAGLQDLRGRSLFLALVIKAGLSRVLPRIRGIEAHRPQWRTPVPDLGLMYGTLFAPNDPRDTSPPWRKGGFTELSTGSHNA